MKFILMITNMDPHYKYNSISNSLFHEKLPDDDPAGSKHVANVYNKKNDNTKTLVIYYEFVLLTVL
jgi:hypothetical protein